MIDVDQASLSDVHPWLVRQYLLPPREIHHAEIVTGGLSTREIALLLGFHPMSIAQILERAHRKLRIAAEAMNLRRDD